MVPAQLPRRTVTTAPARMPGVEPIGGRRHRLKELPRIDKVTVISVLTAEMFASQGEAQVTCQHARAVAEACRVARVPLVTLLVNHCTAQFRVMGPRSAIDVVTANAHPHVVDDADLRVHVDRHAALVLEPVD